MEGPFKGLYPSLRGCLLGLKTTSYEAADRAANSYLYHRLRLLSPKSTPFKMSVDYGNHTLTLPDGTIYNWGESAAANCTLAVCPLALTVYGYIPSLPFSSLLLALYSLCIIIQVGLAWKYKTWTYMTVMVLGCITEIIGWAGRVLMHSNPWNHAGFIIQVGKTTVSMYSISGFADIPGSTHNYRPRVLLCRDLCHDFSNVRLQTFTSAQCFQSC